MPRQPLYHIVDLGNLPGCDITFAQSLNNAGQVVGYSYRRPTPAQRSAGPARPFVWYDGRMVSLQGLGGGSGHALAINERGEIVGDALEGTGAIRPALWQAPRATPDRWSALSPTPLPGPSGFAAAINDGSTIVGNGFLPDPKGSTPILLWRAVRSRRGTRVRRYAFSAPPLPPRDAFRLTAINTAGIALGYSFHGTLAAETGHRPWIYPAGSWKPLAIPAGATGIGQAINASGIIAGWVQPAAGERQPYLWKFGHGGPLDLSTCVRGEAAAVNAIGEIVGTLLDQSGRSRAVIWHDRQAFDLNACVATDAGWEVLSAHGINDRGQIVVRGTHAGKPAAGLLTRR